MAIDEIFGKDMVKKINTAFRYIRNLVTNERQGFKEPSILNFPITDNCNSKCVMCNVWKESVANEITVDEIDNFFQTKYFSAIKHVGISGGEPTLRKDLVECVEMIFFRALKLESLSITTHGFHYNRWDRFAPRLVDLALKFRINFSVNVSIDGDADTHSIIRGVPGAFGRAFKTIQALKKNNIPVQLQCTVSKDNIYTLVDVLQFAKKQNVDCIFRCATEINRLDNENIIGGVALDPGQRSFLADFFMSDILHHSTRSLSRGLYYEQMAKNLTGSVGRNMPCYFQYQGFLLSSKGEVSPCSVSKSVIANMRDDSSTSNLLAQKELVLRDVTVKNECGSCLHDQSGAWSLYDVLRYLLKWKARRFNKLISYAFKLISVGYKVVVLLPRMVGRLKKIDIVKNEIKNILVIGAYGGEHVGDAAILGGVVLRCKQRYERLERIYVSSFRYDRTKRWIDSLDLPVEVSCVPDGKVFSGEIKVDLVVYGGGPLMELPVHLLNHLYIVKKYYSKGIPFSLEGVGVGPVKTKFSRCLIKQLFRCSSYTRVRTRQALVDAERMLISSVELGGDPAFDYIASRAKLDKVSRFEEASLSLLWGNEGSGYRVGINLRPLWEKYSFDVNSSIEEVEDKYMEEMVSSFRSVSEIIDVKYYFFPMNADQFGMSDFLTANILKEKMEREGLLLRIWREEPGVDALVKFVRRMDCVVSMRFHGCIFALSQNTKNVISIDYQLGRDGKVTNVMDDNGGRLKARADTLETQDLSQKLIQAISNERPLIRLID